MWPIVSRILKRNRVLSGSKITSSTSSSPLPSGFLFPYSRSPQRSFVSPSPVLYGNIPLPLLIDQSLIDANENRTEEWHTQPIEASAPAKRLSIVKLF